jgi:hypothetical protein
MTGRKRIEDFHVLDLGEWGSVEVPFVEAWEQCLESLVERGSSTNPDVRARVKAEISGIAAILADADRTSIQRARAGFASGQSRSGTQGDRCHDYQRRVNEIHLANPRMSYSAVCTRIGAEFGVTRKTVSNHTESWKRTPAFQKRSA